MKNSSSLHYKLINLENGTWESFWLVYRNDHVNGKGSWIVSKQLTKVEKPEIGLLNLNFFY